MGFRLYSWLFTQGSFLVGLRIEPKVAAYKTLHAAPSRQLWILIYDNKAQAAKEKAGIGFYKHLKYTSKEGFYQRAVENSTGWTYALHVNDPGFISSTM